MEITIEDITALAEEVEKAASVYKSIMFAENFGADADISPEMALAFGELADVCRDYVDLYSFYDKKPTPEEEAADWEADLIINLGEDYNG